MRPSAWTAAGVCPALVCLLSSVLPVLPVLPVPRALAARPARARGPGRCVRYGQRRLPGGAGVELRLRSGCQVEMACELSWVVRCDGEPPAERESVTVPLAAGAHAEVTPSIASCLDGWRVDGVSWSCEQVR